MNDDEVLLEHTGSGVAVVTLNRPARLNAVTNLIAETLLPQIFAELATDPAVRAVIITGSGRAFCAGADIRERLTTVRASSDASSLGRRFGEFVLGVWEFPKPVIAVVNGVAAGSGMSLAAAADFRFMADTATFVSGFVRRGIMPDSGLTYTLPRLVGRSKAAHILMTGRSVSAAEALAIGLADVVLPVGEVMAGATELAERLAAGPPVALAFTKRALDRAHTNDFPAQLEFESWGQQTCLGTDDFQEGLRAFADKREPRFAGH
jgi:2-(1,2-epoxy-1,2-dihydrophenyl)acetyl-CoA isomerase